MRRLLAWLQIEVDDLDLTATPAGVLLRRAEELRDKARELEAQAHEAVLARLLQVEPVRVRVADINQAAERRRKRA